MKTKSYLFLSCLCLITIFFYGCEQPYLKEKLPVVTTDAVTGITLNTAVCGGEITSDNGLDVTVRGVCWSLKPNPTTSNSLTKDAAGTGKFISNIKNLLPDTSYYVRAYATNSEGTAYGLQVTFNTLKDNIFIDQRDGNVYLTIKIGNQTWMAENLRYLPNVVGPGPGSTTTPYYYVYGYNGTSLTAAKATSNYTTYGVLYNWEAAKAAVPPGWHLPSDAELTQLTDYLGGASVAGGKLKETGTTHWNSPNTGATNETGFTALSDGYRFNNGEFNGIGYVGHWWSAIESNSSYALYWGMRYDGTRVGSGSLNKEVGISIRCVRD